MVNKTLIKHDLFRVGVLSAIAVVMLVSSVPIALLLDEPALAPWGLFCALALFGIAVSHIMRRLLFPSIDLGEYAQAAKGSPQGAGLVFLGVCLALASLFLLMGNLVHASPLPANAVEYIPILKEEQEKHWPDSPLKSSMAAQVEQETCISLSSKRCWSPRAELKTKREQGVGLGQITRTSRFDAMTELKASYPKQLKDWSWADNLYDPRYQLRAVVLKNKQNYSMIEQAATIHDRLAMSYAAYNGGLGGLLSDRQLCRATAQCNHGKWFGHVESTSLKAKRVVSGYGKSFFEINREYVRNVMFVRRMKYATIFGDA